jgi:hypothetical protein
MWYPNFKSISKSFFNNFVTVYQENWCNVLPMLTLYGDYNKLTAIEFSWLFWGVTIYIPHKDTEISSDESES